MRYSDLKNKMQINAHAGIVHVLIIWNPGSWSLPHWPVFIRSSKNHWLCRWPSPLKIIRGMLAKLFLYALIYSLSGVKVLNRDRYGARCWIKAAFFNYSLLRSQWFFEQSNVNRGVMVCQFGGNPVLNKPGLLLFRVCVSWKSDVL